MDLGFSLCSVQLDMDALDLGVELQTVHAELTADADLLVAAKGAKDASAATAVDAHHTGADTLGDLERLVDVPRPDGPGQAIIVLVGYRDDVIERSVRRTITRRQWPRRRRSPTRN